LQTPKSRVCASDLRLKRSIPKRYTQAGSYVEQSIKSAGGF
jgi:hypothetical protein